MDKKEERGVSPNAKDWVYGIVFFIGWLLLAMGISELVGFLFKWKVF